MELLLEELGKGQVMEAEIEHLIGKKVVEVDENTMVFEDGTIIEFHPYETYVYSKSK